MNPADFPITRELFAQWQRARGRRTEPSTRPFSRSWEELLEDARLTSGTERSEAERDAKSLEAEGWVELKTVRYKPHLLNRITIPIAAEERLCKAFGYIPPSDDVLREIRNFSWQPELSFLSETRVNISFAELRQLNDYLKHRSRDLDIVPIKERSLQIFGDEKRLDLLLTSTLFRSGRLDLEKHLHCEIIGVPLAWKRGPSPASTQPILVIENAATWHSYCRWNTERSFFSAVVYGDGNRFVDGIRYLKDLFVELGGIRRVLYFGDLDPQGLLIPQEASARTQAAGQPAIEPHLWSYRELLKMDARCGQPWEGEAPSSTLCDWLKFLAEPARQLIVAGHRLAQEHIGWELLRNVKEIEQA